MRQKSETESGCTVNNFINKDALLCCLLMAAGKTQRQRSCKDIKANELKLFQEPVSRNNDGPNGYRMSCYFSQTSGRALNTPPPSPSLPPFLLEEEDRIKKLAS